MRQNITRVQDVSNLIIENASVISLNFNMRPKVIMLHVALADFHSLCDIFPSKVFVTCNLLLPA